MRIKLYLILASLTLFGCVNRSYAQCGDDACTATTLTVTASGACSYVSCTNVGATPSGMPTLPCSGVNNNDVWYSFTVPTGVTTLLGQVLGNSALGNMNSPIIYFYRGTNCSTLTQLGCANGFVASTASLYYSSFIPGETIWVRVKPLGGTQDGNFQLCVYNPCPTGAPGNDEPCTATTIPMSASCGTYTMTSNFCATGSTGPPAPGCANYQGGDTWYSTTVGANGHLEINFSQGTLGDPGCAVYTGTCSNLTLVACDDDNGPGLLPYIYLSSLPANATVWIRVWTFGGGSVGGTFGLCFTDPCPLGGPANDDPCNATVVAMSSNPCVTFATTSNTCAGASIGPPAPGCANYQGGDVWVQTTVGPNGHLEVNFQEMSLTDVGCAVYTGTCNALTLVACNDDAGPGLMPYLFLTGLAPSSTVWIRIWDYAGNNTGTTGICLTDPCPTSTVAPPLYDDPPCPPPASSANYIPFNSGSCSTYTTYTSLCANSAPTAWPGLPVPTNCNITNFCGWDVWGVIVVPTVPAVGFMDINTQIGSIFDLDLAVYRVTPPVALNCGNGAMYTQIICDDLSGPGLMPYVHVPYGGANPCQPGDTLYVRFWVWGCGAPQGGTWGMCVNNPCPGGTIPPPGYDNPPCNPATAVLTPVTGGPCINYQAGDNICVSLTDNATYNITPTNCAFQNNAPDVWYVVQMPFGGSGQLDFNFQTGLSLTDPGMAIYTGTPGGPCGGTGLTMIACDDDAGPGFLPYISLTNPVAPGQYLYIRIWSYANSARGTFALCVNDPCPTQPSNDVRCNAIALTVGGVCNFNTFSIVCAGTNNTGIPAPGCGLYNGRDVWFSFVAPSSGAVVIDSREGTLTDIDFAVYHSSSGNDCTAGFVLDQCDDNSGPGAMPYLSLTGLVAGRTYWLRVWENGGNQDGDFSLCIFNPCPGGPPANDAICNATTLTLNASQTGFNNCATPDAGITTPSCWSNSPGNLNTVWYKVTGAATYTVIVNPGTLAQPQIAAYRSGASGTNSCGLVVTPITIAGVHVCDINNYAGCKPTANSSVITFAGGSVSPVFAATDTVWIAIDGVGNQVGTFEIAVYGVGVANVPPVPIQDCRRAVPICSQVTAIANPGYLGKGNNCDLGLNTSYGTCFSGFPANGVEDNSSWYFFSTTGTAGNLTFDITANSSGNYDFILWDVTSAAPGALMSGQNGAGDITICNNITSLGGGYGVPVSCNSNTTPTATGLSLSGNGTTPYNAAIAVPASVRYYVLCIMNRDANSQGYTLDFGASPINYAATSVVWTDGSGSSDWFDANNWGSCTSPLCGVHATVVGGLPDQPVITSNATVNNLTITAGSSLTINSGVTLSICGNLTNSGQLICQPNSTVKFVGSAAANQTISGNFTGTNSFWNFTIEKPAASGSVVLSANMDVSGNLSINNANAPFSITGRFIKLAGNFFNAGGTSALPIANVAGSTVEFNGTGVQSFMNTNVGPTTLVLNNVRMNQQTPFDYVELNPSTGNDNNLRVNSTLTLIQGVILTNQWEVFNRSALVGAVVGGSNNSYIEGFHSRNVRGAAAAGSPYLFAVGLGGFYEYASIVKAASGAAGDTLKVRATFKNWPSSPPPNGPVSSECAVANWSAFQAYDNGYWTVDSITRTGSAVLGNYTMNLKPNFAVVGNNGGSLHWSIMKRSPSGTGPWTLNGACRSAPTYSTAYDVYRDNMSGMSDFAVTQYNSPLPIELLYFNAEQTDEGVLCSWVTASEVNNDYFIVERSYDGKEFKEIGRVDGSGTTTVEHSYSFIDKTICEQLTYYRLRQVDFDGQTTAYDDQVVAVDCKARNPIVLRPNPAQTEVYSTFRMAADVRIHIVVVDIMGKTVVMEPHDVTSGENTLRTDISDLAPGVYYMKIIKEGFEEPSFIEKFMKQ